MPDGQRSDGKVIPGLKIGSGLGVAQDRTHEVQVDKKKVLPNALPARRFSASTPRKGYLYIDTWHIIGPWDTDSNGSRQMDFSKVYPPDRKIDLDASYTGGKTKRIFDDERGYFGKSNMTGKLEWKFHQSPSVEVRIPREQLAHDALYFAYTEVYCEQDMELNMAIASDDAARIKVNDNVVFQDTGLSKYVISEKVKAVKFKKGVNKILVRLTNGGGPCRFSLLLVPR